MKIDKTLMDELLKTMTLEELNKRIDNLQWVKDFALSHEKKLEKRRNHLKAIFSK